MKFACGAILYLACHHPPFLDQEEQCRANE